MKLNKVNIDGSVNAHNETDQPSFGYHVPFNLLSFENQIEKNIFPAVFLLNSKGIKTYTSCQGHSLYAYLFNNGLRVNAGPQITIEVPRQHLTKFKKLFTSILITTQINTTIETLDSNILYLSIRPRLIFAFLLSNEFFCRKLFELCDRVEP